MATDSPAGDDSGKHAGDDTDTASGGPDASASPDAAPTLAQRIDRCFTTMHAPDRGEWTYREVAEGVQKLGVTLSPSYLYQLRIGRRDNPTLRQVEALAKFFHVPVAYFVGGDEEVDQIDSEIALMQAMRAPGVRDLAMRASSLKPSGLRAVAALVAEMGGSLSAQPARARRTRRRARSESGPAHPPTAEGGHAGEDQPGDDDGR